jgi:hypothetical protein
MPTQLTERGGILLELIIAAFILASFAAGAARVHRSFRARFERIVTERNQLIARTRGEGR